MGASGFAYDLARQFGLKVVEPRPALVPLTLGGNDVLFRDLSGVSASVRARSGRGKAAASFEEAALFTHRGLSGPAILQASSYWRAREEVGIDFLPHAPGDWLIEAKRDRPRATLRAVLRDHLPGRLADALDERLGLERELGNVPDKDLRAAAARLADWRFTPTGTEGFAKAEVTIGGIDTRELSSQTMEATARTRPLRDRRGGGRDRVAGRLQLPVGLGERRRLWKGDRAAASLAGAAPGAIEQA